MCKFRHLERIRQTYKEHFEDALTYSFLSMKASCIFLIHSLYPDIYENEGGEIIKEINFRIEKKKRMLFYKST